MDGARLDRREVGDGGRGRQVRVEGVPRLQGDLLTLLHLDHGRDVRMPAVVTGAWLIRETTRAIDRDGLHGELLWSEDGELLWSEEAERLERSNDGAILRHGSRTVKPRAAVEPIDLRHPLLAGFAYDAARVRVRPTLGGVDGRQLTDPDRVQPPVHPGGNLAAPVGRRRS